ncbi:hypothetical protein DM860_014414 [Cuscuta australis]|uniref:Uncharacterized protein n=1 Tax=Cuscuta australis TaxID=267555 RepID=A0A328DV01_9ASTE|nr:hypothetical protein DM860_014414 [Cuscuta australis]
MPVLFLAAIEEATPALSPATVEGVTPTLPPAEAEATQALSLMGLFHPRLSNSSSVLFVIDENFQASAALYVPEILNRVTEHLIGDWRRRNSPTAGQHWR